MRGVVDAPEMLLRQVGVDLRRRETDVAEQLLNGAQVRISDLGDVTDSTENIRNDGGWNGMPAIQLMVMRQPNANIIDTTDRVKALLPNLQAAMPPAMISKTRRPWSIAFSYAPLGAWKPSF